MRKILAAISLALVASAPASAADTPLAAFIHARGYRVRINPGSFSLVGDIYPDKNRVGLGRLFQLKDCFSDLAVPEPEELENSTNVLSYGASDSSLLLNFAKSQSSGAIIRIVGNLLNPAALGGLEFSGVARATDVGFHTVQQ